MLGVGTAPSQRPQPIPITRDPGGRLGRPHLIVRGTSGGGGGVDRPGTPGVAHLVHDEQPNRLPLVLYVAMASWTRKDAVLSGAPAPLHGAAGWVGAYGRAARDIAVTVATLLLRRLLSQWRRWPGGDGGCDGGDGHGGSRLTGLLLLQTK